MNELKVQIPGGWLIAETKGALDEYPGIFVTFMPDDENDIVSDLVACVEYVTGEDALRTEVYCSLHDNPVSIINYKDGEEVW